MAQQSYDGLPAKRKLFVDYYISNGGSGTDAYLQAGYSVKKRTTASAAASRLLKSDEIQKAIQERTGLNNNERLILNKEIMDNLIQKATGQEQLVTYRDDTYSSTARDVDQIAAIDRLYKYFIISPLQEQYAGIEMRRADLELRLKEMQIKVIERNIGLNNEQEEEIMNNIEALNRELEEMGGLDLDDIEFEDILSLGDDEQ